MLRFQSSLVLEALHRRAGEVPKDKEELPGNLRNDKDWDWFKVKRIEELLRADKQSRPINPMLIDFAETWCLTFIQNTDYIKAVRQSGVGSVRFYEKVEFTNKLFALLDMDIDDVLLLKMLPSIFSGGVKDEENGLASLIVRKVRDKALLKETVLKNIEQGLPADVLEVHFSICQHFQYRECLPDLYRAIRSNEFLTSWGQNKLTDYYLDLGGKVQDFEEHFAVPIDAEHYASWNRHLIEKAKDSNPELVRPILLGVLTARNQPEANKVHACRLLTHIGEIRALQYWLNFILAKQPAPFDHNQDVIIQHAPDMKAGEVVPVLTQVLEFTYANSLHETLRFPD